MSRIEFIQAGLERLGLPVADSQVARLDEFLGEIELWNPALKLVAAEGDELVVRHLLDCAAGAPVIAARLRGAARTASDRPSGSSLQTVADIGSGAGLPGIPLAVLLPEVTFALVERSGRRAGFLRNAAAGLQNVRVIEADLGEVTDAFLAITYRAFHPLDPRLLGAMVSRLHPGGVICAYKGRMSTLREEIDAIELDDRSDLTVEVVPLAVPFLDEERNLLVITT